MDRAASEAKGHDWRPGCRGGIAVSLRGGGPQRAAARRPDPASDLGWAGRDPYRPNGAPVQRGLITGPGLRQRRHCTALHHAPPRPALPGSPVHVCPSVKRDQADKEFGN